MFCYSTCSTCCSFVCTSASSSVTVTGSTAALHFALIVSMHCLACAAVNSTPCATSATMCFVFTLEVTYGVTICIYMYITTTKMSLVEAFVQDDYSITQLIHSKAYTSICNAARRIQILLFDESTSEKVAYMLKYAMPSLPAVAVQLCLPVCRCLRSRAAAVQHSHLLSGVASSTLALAAPPPQAAIAVMHRNKSCSIYVRSAYCYTVHYIQCSYQITCVLHISFAAASRVLLSTSRRACSTDICTLPPFRFSAAVMSACSCCCVT
jgi:hypothetical protein